MENISILIVENDPSSTDLVRECLELSITGTTEIKEAETLASAMGLIAHYGFDVILVDPTLPDARGLDTIRRLIEASPNAAVIVVSDSQGEESFAIRCVRYGAQDHLEKQHLSPLALRKSIAYAIERKNILQDNQDVLDDLAVALHRIEKLENLLPLCVGCKKIYGRDSLWISLDDYQDRPEIQNEKHLICPDCQDQI